MKPVKEITIEIKIGNEVFFRKSVEVPQLEIDGTEHTCRKIDIERAINMLIGAFKVKLYRNNQSTMINPFVVSREAA